MRSRWKNDVVEVAVPRQRVPDRDVVVQELDLDLRCVTAPARSVYRCTPAVDAETPRGSPGHRWRRRQVCLQHRVRPRLLTRTVAAPECGAPALVRTRSRPCVIERRSSSSSRSRPSAMVRLNSRPSASDSLRWTRPSDQPRSSLMPPPRPRSPSIGNPDRRSVARSRCTVRPLTPRSVARSSTVVTSRFASSAFSTSRRSARPRPSHRHRPSNKPDSECHIFRNSVAAPRKGAAMHIALAPFRLATGITEDDWSRPQMASSGSSPRTRTGYSGVPAQGRRRRVRRPCVL